MTPAERIQAAIESLESLKAESTPGPWLARYVLGKADWPVLVSDGIGTIFDYPEGYAEESDVLLIAALHRTIDAQLAILRFAVTHPLIPFSGEPSFDEHEILLADAILGPASH